MMINKIPISAETYVVDYEEDGQRQKKYFGPATDAEKKADTFIRYLEDKTKLKHDVTFDGTKTKSDTIAGQIETMMSAAAGILLPPEHITLTHDEWPFWESIMMARARNTWNVTDLEQAAVLARTKCTIEKLSNELNLEEDMVDDGRGGKKINPKHDLVEKLTKRCVALARAIHVHATATVGRSRDTGEKTKREQDAREKINKGDDLISRPTVQ